MDDGDRALLRTFHAFTFAVMMRDLKAPEPQKKKGQHYRNWRQRKDDAAVWVASDEDCALSFLCCCEWMGLNPSAARRAIWKRVTVPDKPKG